MQTLLLVLSILIRGVCVAGFATSFVAMFIAAFCPHIGGVLFCAALFGLILFGSGVAKMINI